MICCFPIFTQQKFQLLVRYLEEQSECVREDEELKYDADNEEEEDDEEDDEEEELFLVDFNEEDDNVEDEDYRKHIEEINKFREKYLEDSEDWKYIEEEINKVQQKYMEDSEDWKYLEEEINKVQQKYMEDCENWKYIKEEITKVQTKYLEDYENIEDWEYIEEEIKKVQQKHMEEEIFERELTKLVSFLEYDNSFLTPWNWNLENKYTLGEEVSGGFMLEKNQPRTSVAVDKLAEVNLPRAVKGITMRKIASKIDVEEVSLDFLERYYQRKPNRLSKKQRSSY